MHWGLPKQTLGKIWQVVAGDGPALTQQQFVTCLYLMDMAKQGISVPAQLPPGPFPPGYNPSQRNTPNPSMPQSNASSVVDLNSMQQVGNHSYILEGISFGAVELASHTLSKV